MSIPLRIAPSILSADFARLGEEAQALERAKADLVHVDVMDGRFVPNITLGPAVVAALHRATSLPLDLHLMIVEPDRYIDAFVEAGAAWITVHAEACTHLHRVVQQIRAAGAKPAVAVNPATPLSAVEWVLEDVHLILVMSVNPGFGGQDYIPQVTRKVSELRTLLDARAPHVEIEVDGGVKPANISDVAAAGANVFVAGSAVFAGGPSTYADTIATLRSHAQLGRDRRFQGA